MHVAAPKLLALALLAVAVLFGCAREAPPPLHPYGYYAYPAGYAPYGAHAWNRGAVAYSNSGQAPVGTGAGPVMNGAEYWSSPAPPPFEPPPQPSWPGQAPVLASANIPNGEACLRILNSASQSYRVVSDQRGVSTPVEITGPIAGVRYHAGAGLPFVCDCRLAIALAWSAPILQSLGITDARFSGVYVYRLSRVGRLSLHAHGHAIDLHEFWNDRARYDVERDYRTGLSDSCSPSAPVLNQLACRLKQSALWKEMLTPDYNADHHDHFHLGLSPLEQAPNDTLARASE